jgi:hypothetical protein
MKLRRAWLSCVTTTIVVALTSGCALRREGLIGDTIDGGGGAVVTPGGDAGATTTATGIPCDVQTLLASRCVTCHGVNPSQGAPMSLVTYADLVAPAISNPTMTVSQMAVVRMQATVAQMPPAPAVHASAAEVAILQSWIGAGYPHGGCAGPDAGGDSGSVIDPFGVPPVCTSHTTWTGGDRGSASMNPGLACISCHATTGGEAPSFTVAGTLFPTAHEPDLCNGVSGAVTGAQVVIVGADGQSTTLTPNAAGNFSYAGAIALPFQAKVVYQGRERLMTARQTVGDCNSCHTQAGANGAPGRIILP